MCKVFTEVIEDFEVPEGLELEPSGDIVSEVSDFDFDQGEWSFKRIVREVGQL